MSYFKIVDGSLVLKRRQETLLITPWGQNSLRVRGTQNNNFTENNWALYKTFDMKAEIKITDKGASITNGKIRAELNPYGKIKYYNQKNELILKEYYRSWDYGTENWEDLDQITMVRACGREYKGTPSDSNP